MLGLGRLFSRSGGARKGDGATYGIDYKICATYTLGGVKNYFQEKKFKLGYQDFLQLFEQYSSTKDGFKSIKDVNVLVEPISTNFDSSMLRRKMDAAVKKIQTEKNGLREIAKLLESNSLMHDSPILQEYREKEESYNNAIKGAGLIYEWIKKHEKSGEALKA
jgi:hypothetical protein